MIGSDEQIAFQKKCREFAKQNGYPYPINASLEYRIRVRAFWEGELEEKVSIRDSFARDLSNLQQAIRDNDQKIESARFMLDHSSLGAIQEMTRNMSPEIAARVTLPPGEDS